MKSSSWTSAGIYFFAFLLFFWPYADLLSNAWPVQMGSLEWRYGFAGLLAAYHHTPLLGILLATLWAAHRGQGKVLRSVSALTLLVALGVVLIAGAFALDLLQVRASRPPEVQGAVLAGGVIALLKHFTAAAAMVLLGVGGWISSKADASADRKEAPGVGVVMKKGSGPR